MFMMWMIVTDSKWLEFMVNQIVSNSIKYIDRGQEKTIEIWVEPVGDGKALHIKDNGIGIPKESLNRIFERFYRVDKARSRDIGGTGLGLAITKHMVKSLGGTIEVESILGVGSDFIVTIPLDTK